jgi:hypothetical protein
MLEDLNKRSLHDRIFVLNALLFVLPKDKDNSDIINQIKDVISGANELEDKVHIYLKPPPRHKEDWEIESEREKKERKKEKENLLEKNVANLTARIEGMRTSEDFGALDFIYKEIRKKFKKGDRSGVNNWKDIIPEYGEDIAVAAKEGLIKHWRTYKPEIPRATNGSSVIFFRCLCCHC